MNKIQLFLNRKSIKYGLPFLICVVGGSFGLKEFTQLRYTYAKSSSIKREDIRKQGIEMKEAKEVTLESEYEKVRRLNIDNWEQVRGPRPWEETSDKT